MCVFIFFSRVIIYIYIYTLYNLVFIYNYISITFITCYMEEWRNMEDYMEEYDLRLDSHRILFLK